MRGWVLIGFTQIVGSGNDDPVADVQGGEYVIRANSLQSGATECMFKDESNALFVARVLTMARLREREQRLTEERQRLALILDSVGDGLYGVARSGRVRFANRAAEGYGGGAALVQGTVEASRAPGPCPEFSAAQVPIR